MSRVEINSDGRSVIVDHDDVLPVVVDAALDLWQQVEPTTNRTGAGSAGFSMERGPQWDHDKKPPVRAEWLEMS